MTSAAHRSPRISDELAYVLPMALFLAGVFAGGHWPNLYVPAYVARAIAAAAALFLLRSHYTRVRWNHAWLGAIVGVVGVVQWVGMQAILERHFALFRPDPEAAFNPLTHFAAPWQTWSFIAVRLASATLVVPFVEELFWRDWMWRTVLAPNDFKLAAVGEPGWPAIAFVTLAFATVHANWGLTAIVWAAGVAALLVYTRSLGACIIAHGTTNLLLGAYVLWTHHWSLW
jgi:CAAX prenyl protease-like protein